MIYAFDIFQGKFAAKDACSTTALAGFEVAYDAMLVLAAENPSPYFMFSRNDRICVASGDTSERESKLDMLT